MGCWASNPTGTLQIHTHERKVTRGSFSRRGSDQSVSISSEMTSLKQILCYQLPTRQFIAYCVRSLCSENIFFWLEVESYISLNDSDSLRRVARKIYKKYISDDSKTQVNISYVNKQDILDNLIGGNRYLFSRVRHMCL